MAQGLCCWQGLRAVSCVRVLSRLLPLPHVRVRVSVFATAQGWRCAYFTAQGLLQCHDCMVTHAYAGWCAWLALQKGTRKKKIKIDAPNRYERRYKSIYESHHFATLVK